MFTGSTERFLSLMLHRPRFSISPSIPSTNSIMFFINLKKAAKWKITRNVLTRNDNNGPIKNHCQEIPFLWFTS
ncbi:CLUMA_CG008553, isoform A [Clunio marinus]|uniref:CLUMA_CG008553, isoform A n=1 Tax=Clunio marinus TaxID=568069 RepID=A0A1J1I4F4_9DIPT|nr:CLUMA_CG008553, isoform A [Clunio marinus]